MRIGLGITTHNRYRVFLQSYLSWRFLLPANGKLVVVDDGSDFPVEEAHFRFDTPQGIATAKNKCLELLHDCDVVFLADDDIYPTQAQWWNIYTEANLEHACFTFGRRVLNTKPRYIEFEKPCGCLLYLTRKAIDTVGGYDTTFHKYGYEHVNLSDRIFNNGLTPARYLDVPLSRSFFISLDERKAVESSVSKKDRIANIYHNKKLYEENYNSKQFIPYT